MTRNNNIKYITLVLEHNDIIQRLIALVLLFLSSDDSQQIYPGFIL